MNYSKVKRFLWITLLILGTTLPSFAFAWPLSEIPVTPTPVGTSTTDYCLDNSYITNLNPEVNAGFTVGYGMVGTNLLSSSTIAQSFVDAANYSTVNFDPRSYGYPTTTGGSCQAGFDFDLTPYLGNLSAIEVCAANGGSLMTGGSVGYCYYAIFDASGTPTGTTTPNTTTHIATVTPSGGSNVATSSTATFGVSGYINPNDFATGTTQVYLHFVLNSQSANSGYAAGIAGVSGTTITFPISSAGPFNVSTTSSLLTGGNYQLTANIDQTSSISTAVNWVLGIFGLSNGNDDENVLAATTSAFTAAAPNSFDTFGASTTAALQSVFDAENIDFSSCDSFTSFNPVNCFVLIFGWQGPGMTAAAQSVYNNLLTLAPFGYVTRVITIFGSGATSSLPVISYTFANDFPVASLQNQNFSFDFNVPLAQAEDLVYTEWTSDDPSNPQTIWQIVKPAYQIILGMGLLYMIFQDLFGIYKHERGGNH